MRTSSHEIVAIGSSRLNPCCPVACRQASRIGPGVIPTGLRIVPHGELTAEEKAKRLAAYAAVDAHVKDHHKVLGIGRVILPLPFLLHSGRMRTAVIGGMLPLALPSPRMAAAR